MISSVSEVTLEAVVKTDRYLHTQRMSMLNTTLRNIKVKYTFASLH